MSVEDKDKRGPDVGAAREGQHPRNESDESRKGRTGAGQVATNDAPGDHSEEHQSNYGGGGTNGGSKS